MDLTEAMAQLNEYRKKDAALYLKPASAPPSQTPSTKIASGGTAIVPTTSVAQKAPMTQAQIGEWVEGATHTVWSSPLNPWGWIPGQGYLTGMPSHWTRSDPAEVGKVKYGDKTAAVGTAAVDAASSLGNLASDVGASAKNEYTKRVKQFEEQARYLANLLSSMNPKDAITDAAGSATEGIKGTLKYGFDQILFYVAILGGAYFLLPPLLLKLTSRSA